MQGIEEFYHGRTGITAGSQLRTMFMALIIVSSKLIVWFSIEDPWTRKAKFCPFAGDGP
jgi:hypothetical protein